MSNNRGFRQFVIIVHVVLLSVFFVSQNSAQERQLSREDKWIAKINKTINERGYRWTAGKTSVSLYTEEEWKLMNPPLPPMPQDLIQSIPVISAPLGASYPIAFDWRDEGVITPVKDQHYPKWCGSCWAFAAVAQLEAHMQIAGGIIENLDLSEQQLVSCYSLGEGHGCHGASWWDAYYVFERPGAVDELCMPYEADSYVPCKQGSCTVQARISEYFGVRNDVNSIKEALQDGPVWIGMYIPDVFRAFSPEEEDEVFDWDCLEHDTLQVITHAMLCVGWNDTICDGEGAWIIKNSWGTDWGYNGYAYVKYDICSLGDLTAQIKYEHPSGADYRVVYPDSGETWFVGGDYYIKWHSNVAGVDHFEVGYDDGIDYFVINDSVNGDERFLLWTVPNNVTSNAKIHVKAYDATENEITSDTSDQSFSIRTIEHIAWSPGGIAACNETHYQSSPQVVTAADSAGAITVWMDGRNGYSKIYAQLINSNGSAQWTTNGIPICTASGEQQFPQAIPDNSGGAIIIWIDYRNGTLPDIFAQRIDQNGNLLWNSDGTPVCVDEYFQSNVQMISDAGGGAIVVWKNPTNNGDIYAQKIDQYGSRKWGISGTAICTSECYSSYPCVASDGNGGAIIAWQNEDLFSYPYVKHPDIYAQRIDQSGSIQWSTNGIVVCSAENTQDEARIISDGAYGAIVIWRDNRHGAESEEWWNLLGFFDRDIYAQRIASDGTMLWTSDGIPICNELRSQGMHRIINHKYGGAIVTWYDYRDDLGDIYAARIDLDGNIKWTSNGITVSRHEHLQNNPYITDDGSGGVIIAWADNRDLKWFTGSKRYTHTGSVYIQRINSLGFADWYGNGELLCNKIQESQTNVRMTEQHGSDVYIVWEDSRNVNTDIYIQKLDGDYSAVPRCDVTAKILHGDSLYSLPDRYLYGCPQGDEIDTLVVTCDFNDDDMAGDSIIYPYEIDLETLNLPISYCDPTDDGIPGTPGNSFVVTVYLSHISGCCDCMGGSCHDCNIGPQDIPVLYKGREVGLIEGLRQKSPDINNDGAVNLSDAAYLGESYNKSYGDPEFNGCWDFNSDNEVNLSDIGEFGYHYLHECPTSPSPLRFNDVAVSDVSLKLRVKGTDGERQSEVIRVSVAIDGADYLSAMCLGLNNEIPGIEFERWIPAPSSGNIAAVTPIVHEGRSLLFITTLGSEPLQDSSIELGTIEYVSNDRAESSPIDQSDLVLAFGDVLERNGSIKRIAGVEFMDETPEYRNYLASAYPNPFNPTTTIRYSVRERTHVSLKIYDVGGRLVKTLVDEAKNPNSNGHSVEWNGRNNLGHRVSSGLYFYRLVAGSFTKTKKMVLLR